MDQQATVALIDDFWVYCLQLKKASMANIGIFGSVDASYSMDGRAALAETTNTVSFLSLIQSVFCALIDTLPTGVELKFGSFADNARVDFSSESLTDEQRVDAKSALSSLRTRGSTNLSAAVEIGFKNINAEERIVMVLTDGSPTIHPSTGERAHLKELVDTPSGQKTTLIIVAIANSSLDLDLMHEMAATTGGYLVYINDASMGATCVINAMATICTVAQANIKAFASCDAPVEAMASAMYKTGEDGNAVVNVGLLTTGSYRTVVCRLPREGHETPPPVSFTCDGVTTVTNAPVQDEASVSFVAGEYARHLVTMTLSEVASKASSVRLQPACQTEMTRCAEKIASLASLYPKQKVCAELLKGLDNELEKAVRPEYIQKWGRGAIFAALNAHWNRICINFKDPDVQMYATDTSVDIRAKAAAAFKDPPTTVAARPPSDGYSTSRSLAPPQTVDFSAYINQGGGCFAPGSPIMTASGFVSVERLTPGMRLSSGATVRYVLSRPASETTTAFIQVGPCAFVTPFHPVESMGQWVWPCLLNMPERRSCDALYNVILDDGSAVDLDGGDGRLVRAVSLGHGLEGQFVSHRVYGSKSDAIKLAQRSDIYQNLRLVAAA